jgi:NADH-quinone oxidoreductase subunit K
MMIYYYLAAFLFCLGLLGSLIKKDVVSILICVELMLTACGLFFVLFSKTLGNIDGQLQVFFVIIVAAAEAAIGLSLVIAMFKKIKSAYSEDIQIYSE